MFTTIVGLDISCGIVVIFCNEVIIEVFFVVFSSPSFERGPGGKDTTESEGRHKEIQEEHKSIKKESPVANQRARTE